MKPSQKEPDFFSRWADVQENVFRQWMEAAGSVPHLWMEAAAGKGATGAAFAPGDSFADWAKLMSDTMGTIGGSSDDDGAGKVLFRMMRAGAVFAMVQHFWSELCRDLPELLSARNDDEKTRNIFDRWVAAYTKIFEQMFGTAPSADYEEMMKAWLSASGMHLWPFGHVPNPWMRLAPRAPEQFQAFLRGEPWGLSGRDSLWRQVYDETLGRVFRMPAFGLTKEQVEKIRRAYDTFLQFGLALPRFHLYFYNASMAALRQMFEKIRTLEREEFTPETAREIYRLWIQTNEDALRELFRKPDFGNAMSEILHLGLRLKKRIDDLNSDWCEAMSIPSNRDFDAMVKTVHELRRTVRRQQKAIEALQQQVSSAAEGRRDG